MGPDHDLSVDLQGALVTGSFLHEYLQNDLPIRPPLCRSAVPNFPSWTDFWAGEQKKHKSWTIFTILRQVNAFHVESFPHNAHGKNASHRSCYLLPISGCQAVNCLIFPASTEGSAVPVQLLAEHDFGNAASGRPPEGA